MWTGFVLCSVHLRYPRRATDHPEDRSLGGRYRESHPSKDRTDTGRLKGNGLAPRVGTRYDEYPVLIAAFDIYGHRFVKEERVTAFLNLNRVFEESPASSICPDAFFPKAHKRGLWCLLSSQHPISLLSSSGSLRSVPSISSVPHISRCSCRT